MQGKLSVDTSLLATSSLQALLLHGEQYLEMHAPLPPSGKLLTTARVLDTQDKGKAAVVVIHTVSRYVVPDVQGMFGHACQMGVLPGWHSQALCMTALRCAQTGRIIAENEITSFNRGAGGFGKRPPVQRKPAAVARNTPPE